MIQAVATGLHDAIAELAGFNDDPAAGGITREVYTPTYAAALERVAEWMREAGLQTRLDAVGNLYGRREGSDPGAPACHFHREAAPVSLACRSGAVQRQDPCRWR